MTQEPEILEDRPIAGTDHELVIEQEGEQFNVYAIRPDRKTSDVQTAENFEKAQIIGLAIGTELRAYQLPERSTVTLTPEGKITVTDFDALKGSSLEHLQSQVEGNVDGVGIAGDVDMWLNDEGLINGSSENVHANYVAEAFGIDHQPWCGTVCFTGGADREGNTLPLEKDKAEALVWMCEAATTMPNPELEPEEINTRLDAFDTRWKHGLGSTGDEMRRSSATVRPAPPFEVSPPSPEVGL